MPRPPPLPKGWITAAPDYVGIGVQKAGTTWLHSLIEAHPEVSKRTDGVKELHFFDRFAIETGDAEDLGATYARYFPRAPGTLAGEWTPRYIHNFWTIPLLHEAAPRARLLVSFRDPIERYWSGLAHRAAAGRPASPGTRRRSRRSIDTIEFSLYADEAAGRSRYGAQFSHLLKYFPREQILVLQYERCCDDPQGELDRICRFLGLDRIVLPEGVLRRRVGPVSGESPRIGAETTAALASYLADDISRFLKLAPEIDASLWESWRRAQ